MDDLTELHATVARQRLVQTLVEYGAVADPEWRVAFEQVPRHLFLRQFFQLDDGGGWSAVAEGDPDWLNLVYANRVLVTQLDDDSDRWRLARKSGPIAGTPSSSASMPTIMAMMLEQLMVRGGHRILEVGTGTGYNAALLCQRLGAVNVSTVDIDSRLSALAAGQLADCGFHPEVVDGDGMEGWPPGAPFDRVLATCAVNRIPPAWLAQTAPGGLVMTTLNRPLGCGLVRITVIADGQGQGRVLPVDSRFMPARAQRGPELLGLVRRAELEHGDIRLTSVAMSAALHPASPFEFFAGLALPDAQVLTEYRDGHEVSWLLAPDGSWARQQVERGRYTVEQGGPRPLWDLAETAYHRWYTLGQPSRDRFGITVDGPSQWLWLDHPNSPHRWPL